MDGAIVRGMASVAAASLATGAGGALLFVNSRLSGRWVWAGKGFSGGVMLAVSIFSLALPSIESAGGGKKGLAVALCGMALGSALVFMADRLMLGGEMGDTYRGGQRIRGHAWLVFMAMALHDLPEGLAIGVALSDPRLDASGVITAIALHNIPEGFAVALAWRSEGRSTARAVLMALLSGSPAILGTLIAISVSKLSLGYLPFLLAIAAGTMLYIVFDEIIPGDGEEGARFRNTMTWSLMAGFLLMMTLEYLLG